MTKSLRGGEADEAIAWLQRLPGQVGLRSRHDVHKTKLPVVLHELGHVLGLLHEHQRDDRDKYIVVDLDNLEKPVGKEKQAESQVEIIPEHDPNRKVLDPTKYGSYDLKVSGSTIISMSIMHYSSNSNSNGEGPVMVLLSGAPIPNSSKISAGDAATVRAIYEDSQKDGDRARIEALKKRLRDLEAKYDGIVSQVRRYEALLPAYQSRLQSVGVTLRSYQQNYEQCQRQYLVQATLAYWSAVYGLWNYYYYYATAALHSLRQARYLSGTAIPAANRQKAELTAKISQTASTVKSLKAEGASLLREAEKIKAELRAAHT